MKREGGASKKRKVAERAGVEVVIERVPGFPSPMRSSAVASATDEAGKLNREPTVPLLPYGWSREAMGAGSPTRWADRPLAERAAYHQATQAMVDLSLAAGEASIAYGGVVEARNERLVKAGRLGAVPEEREVKPKPRRAGR